MTSTHIVFVAVGWAALIAGAIMLVRPNWVRALLGIAPGEPATYALRIAGGMFASFGILLGGFAIALERARAGL